MRRPSRSSAPRERRQSGRLTRRLLRQSLSGGARKWLKGVWQAAEQYTLRLSSLSSVTSPLATKLIEEYMAELDLAGELTQREFFLALVAGYSARAVLADPTEQPGLQTASPQADEDWVRTIASEEFGSVMTLPPEVWSGYVLTATMKLQGRLATHKLPWYMLGRERVETLLRQGYVLRCLDEALEAEPVLQEAAS